MTTKPAAAAAAQINNRYDGLLLLPAKVTAVLFQHCRKVFILLTR